MQVKIRHLIVSGSLQWIAGRHAKKESSIFHNAGNRIYFNSANTSTDYITLREKLGFFDD